MPKIISIVNQKGGVGKTTTTLNIGAGLSKLGKKVLLIDLDPQSNLTEYLNHDYEQDKPNISDLMLDTTLNIGAGLSKLGKKVLLIDLDPQSNLTEYLNHDYEQDKPNISDLMLDTLNIGAGLSKLGKKVLLIDLDPQSNLTEYLNHDYEQDKPNISDLMLDISNNKKINIKNSICSNDKEDLDYIPSNISLSSADLFLSQTMCREKVLDKIVKDTSLSDYDYIIIDCLPSLSILLVNALACSDSIIIPVQTQKFALDGVSLLLQVFNMVKDNINPKLKIDGILLTMTDNTNMSKAVEKSLREDFKDIVFKSTIKKSVEAISLSSADLFLSQTMCREKVLDKIVKDNSLSDYDYIIIDCLPSLSILLVNALACSDSIIIPVQTQKFALDGVSLLLQVFNMVKDNINPKLKIDGILLTMTDNTNMSKAVEKSLREDFKDIVFKSTIKKSVEATNSTYKRQSLITTSKSKLGEQYLNVTNEYLERI